VQGVNAYFERDMQFEQKRPKSGGGELNFKHSDSFLDNLIYSYSDRYYSYVESFLYGCLGEMPERKIH
jgi:hypothetical protein